MDATTLSEINAILGTSSGAAAKTGAQEINDRFLKLLVAQLNNQDPLNPLDNAQVTTQMAQINTVTGINNLSDTVGKLLEQFAAMQSLQAAALTGRDVLVTGSRMVLGAEGAARGGLELAGDATGVTVEVRDANGLLVRSLDLGAQPAGVHSFEWDGNAEGGARAAAGNYSFTVKARAGATEFAADALMAGRVEGVRNDGGTLQLVLTGVGAVAYADVKQII